MHPAFTRSLKKLNWFGRCVVGVALWGVTCSTLILFGQLDPRDRRQAVDAVYGPTIAVPRETPVTALKPRNLIDQTREEAHVKSAG